MIKTMGVMEDGCMKDSSTLAQKVFYLKTIMNLLVDSKASAKSQMKSSKEKKELIKSVMLKTMEEIMKNFEIY
jgi:hypothetical protein